MAHVNGTPECNLDQPYVSQCAEEWTRKWHSNGGQETNPTTNRKGQNAPEQLSERETPRRPQGMARERTQTPPWKRTHECTQRTLNHATTTGLKRKHTNATSQCRTGLNRNGPLTTRTRLACTKIDRRKSVRNAHEQTRRNPGRHPAKRPATNRDPVSARQWNLTNTSPNPITPRAYL